jgi:hypothetical protein
MNISLYIGITAPLIFIPMSGIFACLISCFKNKHLKHVKQINLRRYAVHANLVEKIQKEYLDCYKPNV